MMKDGGKWRETGTKTTNRARRNMQDHQKESKTGHQEIQPRYHTRNDHDIKEPEESPKNAEGRPRQTGHTPGQAGERNQ